MFVINSNLSKFIIGIKVIVVKPYNNGNVNLKVGDFGIIKSASYMDLPDMGLFNIRVIDIEFGSKILHMGEQVAEEYIDIL